jgi:outer membrane protein assembly factor BamC
VTRAFLRSTPVRAACLMLAAAALSACSAIENFVGGDKLDYRSAGTTRSQGLEVPPDLSQLARDQRYVQPVGGSVSASALQSGAPAAAAAAVSTSVAPKAIGDLRIERQGNQRWLVTPLPPEQLWPQLQGFWKERGFTLAVDQANAGVMETDWAENRAKLPQDLIRNTIGKVLDSLYSTGERDKFRTRVERNAAGGSEVFISHKGLEEIYSGERKDTVVWQPRAADPLLEGEMLQRLMVKLGEKEEQAKSAVAATTPGVAGPARARLVTGQPAATLQVDDGFDRAWRRVGLALDRSGFTVEDRDRTQGIYFVRYVDPKNAGKEEPGFFSKLFSFGKKSDVSGPTKYRVSVKGDGERSTVTVLDAAGQPETGDAGKQIVGLLVEDLK